MNLHVFQGQIKLLDYLFFATFERGKVAETGPFIHNYALTYAMGLVGAALRTSEQSPHYVEELSPLNEQGTYITPARMLAGEAVMMQYNTINEGYSLGRGRNIGYPNWGFIRAIRPESEFSYYIISADPDIYLPEYIRLGKFMAKAGVKYIKGQVKEAGARFTCDCILNPFDVKESPVFFQRVYQVLPSNLIERASFDGTPGWQAEFAGQTVCLPAGMAYCVRRPGKTGRDRIAIGRRERNKTKSES